MKTKWFRILCTAALLFSASFAANAQFGALKDRVKKAAATQVIKEANKAEKKVAEKANEYRMYSIAKQSDFNEHSQPEELFANLAYELKQIKTALAENDIEHLACLHCYQTNKLINLLAANQNTDRQQLQEWQDENHKVMTEADAVIYKDMPTYDKTTEETLHNTTCDVLQYYINKVNAPSAGTNSKEYYLAQANAVRQIRMERGEILTKDSRYQKIYKQLQSLYASTRSEYKLTWKMKDDDVILKEREAYLARQKQEAEQKEMERKQQEATRQAAAQTAHQTSATKSTGQASTASKSGGIEKFYNSIRQHIGHIDNGSLEVFNKNNQRIGRIETDGRIFSQINSRIGQFRNSSFYNGSNQFIGKLESDGTVRNKSNEIIGKISNGRVVNAQNQTIGFTQADKRWAAAFYFFNYFKW